MARHPGKIIGRTAILYCLYCALSMAMPIETFSNEKEIKATGHYIYVLPSSESEAYGREVALHRAKISAIEENFGTVISLQNITEINNSESYSNTKFSSYGMSEVKGEWIETIKGPTFKTSTSNSGEILIECYVTGIIRELSHAPVSFDAQVLCNGTSQKFARSDFKHNDDLYLSFRSPSEGYIAAYLRDEERNAFRLLPYPSSGMQSVKISADKEYVFFSPEKAPDELIGSTVPYHLTASSQVEHNFIYVIFSPTPFSIPNDIVGGEYNLRMLPFEDYEKWIGKTRRLNRNVQIMEIPIRISM